MFTGTKSSAFFSTATKSSQIEKINIGVMKIANLFPYFGKSLKNIRYKYIHEQIEQNEDLKSKPVEKQPFYNYFKMHFYEFVRI
jgi:hypothetical protein